MSLIIDVIFSLLLITIYVIISPTLMLLLFIYNFILLKLISFKWQCCLSFVLLLSGILLGYQHTKGIAYLYHLYLANLSILKTLSFGENGFYYILTKHDLNIYDYLELMAVAMIGSIILIWLRWVFGVRGDDKTPNVINLGINIGNSSGGEPIILTHAELNQHTLVLGTTGSGKTNTLLNIVSECCKSGLPLIYLDGKGSIDLVNKIASICDKYGRVFKVFSIDPIDGMVNLSSYNPFAFGNFTQWKNKIITLLGEATNKGQEHYATNEQSYINLVCEILYKSKVRVDLEVILGYLLNVDELQKLANKIDPYIAKRLIEFNLKKQETNDLVKTLELFYYSNYGKLFSCANKTDDQIIDLAKSLINNEIVLFLFDSASYKRDTDLLGKLVINDINAAFANLGRQSKRINAYAIFDEFAAYASPNMASILALQRSNGLHAIVGTQSINAISMESNDIKRIAVELIANCNTFIIHKLNDAKDIELLQSTIGSDNKYVLSSISGDDSGNLHTNINLKDIYIIDDMLIRRLRPGEAYVCRTTTSIKPQLVIMNKVV